MHDQVQNRKAEGLTGAQSQDCGHVLFSPSMKISNAIISPQVDMFCKWFSVLCTDVCPCCVITNIRKSTSSAQTWIRSVVRSNCNYTYMQTFIHAKIQTCACSESCGVKLSFSFAYDYHHSVYVYICTPCLVFKCR